MKSKLRLHVPFHVVLFVLLVTSFRWALAGAIAFERGDFIWVANADGTGSRKLTKGVAPSFSPDGKQLAFQTDSSTASEVVRQIAIADVASGRVTVFHDGVPSRNCQQAVWSPDGAHIVFSIFDGSDWNLAMIKSDGSAFRYLRKTGQGRRSVWSICWARDSQSIYGQDFDNIYQLSLDGTELRKWSVNSMFPKGALSSSSGMAISPDGNVLVIDVEMDEETANSIGSDDGPPTAIWTYNLATGKAERITKPGLMAWHPCWLNDKEILFSTQARKEKTPSLYKLSIPPKQAARLLQNANDPVAAAPFP